VNNFNTLVDTSKDLGKALGILESAVSLLLDIDLEKKSHIDRRDIVVEKTQKMLEEQNAKFEQALKNLEKYK
jgi:hypothetical protein